MKNRGPFARALDILFPPKCPFCRALLRRGEEGLCHRCRRDLPWTGADCAKDVEDVVKCVSPLWYQDLVRQSIHRYKFRGKTAYARTYGALMAKCVREELAGAWDLMTWVPLSARRYAQRGYDQAMLLAMATALELGDVAAETLRKPQDVAAQSGLKDAAARRANVLGVFEVPDRELVEGKRVLLVDDVVTTGATLSECARTLLAAGAREVRCITLARAGK